MIEYIKFLFLVLFCYLIVRAFLSYDKASYTHTKSTWYWFKFYFKRDL